MNNEKQRLLVHRYRKELAYYIKENPRFTIDDIINNPERFHFFLNWIKLHPVPKGFVVH